MKSLKVLAKAACLTTAALLSVSPQPSQAQDQYPSRPIKLIVGFAPGGATDILARVIAKGMSDTLGQPVVVENKVGGATTVAAVSVAKAPADGYTLMLGASTTLTTNPALRTDLPYDPIKSYTQLGGIADMTLVIAMNNAVRVNSLAELIAQSKKEPGKFFYGSSGTGSAMHFAGEQLKYESGLAWEHVPFNGSSPNLTALIGGQIQFASDTIVATTPQVKAGKMKLLAVMSSKRLPEFPDVPTVAEQVPGFNYSTFFGLQGPAGIPASVQSKLESVLNEVANSAEVKKKLVEIGLTPNYMTVQQITARIERELAQYRTVAARANIKVE